jgi:23S rRNA (guanosine2251-2'-O)-methyltransferase
LPNKFLTVTIYEQEKENRSIRRFLFQICLNMGLNMQKEETKLSPSGLFEGMTSISALLNSTPEINDRKILEVLIDESKQKSKASEIGFLKAKSHELGFPVRFVSNDEIASLAIGSSHGGILAVCSDRTIPELSPDRISPNGFYVYLEGIEDPYNFGNAIRSLYAAGVTGVVVPPRNWMSAAGVVARASAGASERMPIFSAEPEQLIHSFHEMGYQILCAGIRSSVSLYEEAFSFPILLVIGGEKRGISRNILQKADKIVRIDYGREFRGSLSASASASILSFEIMRQNLKK